MSDWPVVALGDLVEEITVGFVGSMTHEYIESGVPFFRSKNISEYEIDWKDIKYISEKFHKKLKKSTLRPGDVAIVRTGKPGTTCVIPESVAEANCSDIVIVRVDDKKLSAHYLSYFMNSIAVNQINSHLVGAVQQHFNVGSAKKIEIPLPSRIEQERIVKVLKDLDDKRKLNRQTNQTLEHMAQAIFKSWFVDFEPTRAKIAAKEEWAKRSITTKAGGSDNNIKESQSAATFIERAAMAAISGRAIDSTNDSAAGALAGLDQLNPEQLQQLKTTAALFPDTLVDSELGEIPEGWEVKSLSKMVEIIGGGTPKKSESEFWDGDIPWFSVKDAPADGDVFVIDTDLKITELGLNKSSTKLLPEGVTIISARGTVGRLALVGVPTAMNQSCYGIKGANGIGPYLNYFNLKNAVETLQQNTHGAVFDTITTSTFDTVFCANSGQGLKDVFDELVSNNFEKIKNNLFESKGLVGIRDSLLPKLLSGELPAKAQLPTLMRHPH
jgi:type I restriction enzyme S subunit